MDSTNSTSTIIFAVQINDIKKIGLHARPIAKIVGKISAYKETTVEVVKLDEKTDITKKIVLTGNETKANAKSVLSFIGLQVNNLTKIAFIINGEQAQNAKDVIKAVLVEEKLITQC